MIRRSVHYSALGRHVRVRQSQSCLRKPNEPGAIGGKRGGRGGGRGGIGSGGNPIAVQVVDDNDIQLPARMLDKCSRCLI